MRGKEMDVGIVSGVAGITPAHAGKSANADDTGRFFEDHPRACGEKHCKKRTWQAAKGSPPRMRGKVRSLSEGPAADRITPAHAGKSETDRDKMTATEDHPRACGEKVILLLSKS